MADAENPGAPKIAVYYFPGWHSDRRTDAWHGQGWTEWDVLSAARPRFPGHDQPRASAWGEFDESDPYWASRQATLAKDAGVDAFLFDWYWYENSPFLNAALDDGFLGSRKPAVEFGLMWANHDWMNIHPASAVGSPQVLLRGAVNDDEFDAMADHLIERYFHHPSYLRIDGEPYFSIYELTTLVAGFESVAAAARALDRLRRRAEASGLPGLHLNAIASHRGVLPGEQPQRAEFPDLVQQLGISSTTSYVWIHHYDPSLFGFPESSYASAAQANVDLWQHLRSEQLVPYSPNVTVGWDSSPRATQSDTFEDRGYPWTAVLQGNTPERFHDAMASALDFAFENGSPLVTVNAWNEWTEGSYLLPDSVTGDAHLRALHRARMSAFRRDIVTR